MGSACLLGSGKAKEKIVAFSNGIGVKVSPNEIGQKLESCLPWYDALCLTGAGMQLSGDIVLDNDLFKKKAT